MCEAGEKAESECLVQALTFVREVCVWGTCPGFCGWYGGTGGKNPRPTKADISGISASLPHVLASNV